MDDVRALALSRDGSLLATGTRQGAVQGWRVDGGEEELHLRHNGLVRVVAFSPDDRYLVTGNENGGARTWEIESEQEIGRVSHDLGINAIAFSPDGRYLATGSQDRTARLWLWRAEDLVEEVCGRLTPAQLSLGAVDWDKYLDEGETAGPCGRVS